MTTWQDGEDWEAAYGLEETLAVNHLRRARRREVVRLVRRLSWHHVHRYKSGAKIGSVNGTYCTLRSLLTGAIIRLPFA